MHTKAGWSTSKHGLICTVTVIAVVNGLVWVLRIWNETVYGSFRVNALIIIIILMIIAVPADNRIKLKENSKTKKFPDLTKLTVIPIVIGALGTVTKD